MNRICSLDGRDKIMLKVLMEIHFKHLVVDRGITLAQYVGKLL
jgi:hypothetical protein